MITQANKSMWHCHNVSGLGEYVTYHTFSFLSWPFSFLSLFLRLRCTSTCRPISTINTSSDVFPRKNLHFVGPIVDFVHLRDQTPPQKKPFWVHKCVFKNCKILKPAYYQNYCIDSHQILNNNKDHQVLFLGGRIMHPTNPKWQMAAILKNQLPLSPQPQNSEIKSQWFD